MTKQEMRDLLAAIPASTRRKVTTTYAGSAVPGNGKAGKVPAALRLRATRCSAKMPFNSTDQQVSH